MGSCFCLLPSPFNNVDSTKNVCVCTCASTKNLHNATPVYSTSTHPHITKGQICRRSNVTNFWPFGQNPGLSWITMTYIYPLSLLIILGSLQPLPHCWLYSPHSSPSPFSLLLQTCRASVEDFFRRNLLAIGGIGIAIGFFEVMNKPLLPVQWTKGPEKMFHISSHANVLV